MNKCENPGKELHHLNPKGSPIDSNAQWLCEQCHQMTPSYGKPRSGADPLPFPDVVRTRVVGRSMGKCQCSPCRCVKQKALGNLAEVIERDGKKKV